MNPEDENINQKKKKKKKDVEFLCQLFTLKEIDYKYLHLHSSHNETRNFKHRFVHVMNSFALSLFIYKFFMRVSEQMDQKEMLVNQRIVMIYVLIKSLENICNKISLLNNFFV